MIYHDTVSIVRAPLAAEDPYGNQSRDWAAATTTTNVPAEVQPVASDEQVVNEDRVVTRWRLFLGPTADLVYTDRVTWDGGTFEVDGEVERWKRRSGLHHLEAVLKRVTL